MSDSKTITVRFKELSNKLKFDRIADINDRSTNREAERVLIEYIESWEDKHGKLKIEE